jgi:hypothetical protein
LPKGSDDGAVISYWVLVIGGEAIEQKNMTIRVEAQSEVLDECVNLVIRSLLDTDLRFVKQSQRCKSSDPHSKDSYFVFLTYQFNKNGR